MQYANRFYHRQFLHRQEMTTGLLNRFLTTIDSYANLQGTQAQRSALQTETTIPTIEEIADQLAMTPRYLSDALKVGTGKTAIENLHFHVIDQAKDMLLQPNTSVGEVAYKLGFEYPQYFSRLFKKKVGMTPTEYRKSYH